MLRRIDVHDDIVEAVGPEIPVIFRPSSTHTLTYPCVVYDAVNYPRSYSNDTMYVMSEEYEIKFMSNRPGDLRSLQILNILGSTHMRTFIHDDIVHDIFRIRHMST
jgi:hypothetical protein